VNKLVFQTVLYGESQAANGLTDLAGLAGQDHVASGDKIELKNERPFLHGMGSLTDTKPQGCALVPDNGNSNKPIYGPGGIDFFNDGWAQWMRELPMELFRSDQLTGQISSTNVNEGGIVAFDIVYNEIIKPWSLQEVRSRYEAIFSQQGVVTSATALVFNDGAVALDSFATETANWLDPEKDYDILGVAQSISAATFGGIATISKNLTGEWAGKFPGLIVNPLSAATFNAGFAMAKALEPIPFSGDSLPQIGMTATSAGLINFALVMGRYSGRRSR